MTLELGSVLVRRNRRRAAAYQYRHGGPERFVVVGELEGRAVLRVFTGPVATLRRRFVPLAEVWAKFTPEG